MWALSAACKPAGLHHLGERILKYALATKKILYSDCQASENVQTQEALPRTTRVVKFYIDHYVPKLNLEVLRLMVKRLNPALTEMVNRKGRGKMDKAAMLKEVSYQLLQLEAVDVINNWIPPTVLAEINTARGFQTAETYVVGTQSLQLQELAKGAKFDLQDQDATTLLENGGAEIMIKMLNAVHYNAV